MKISKNFSLNELHTSVTARKLGIDNTPSDDEIEKLIALVENVLQPVRDHFGRPVNVNSAYRGEQLNEAVNGSNNSQHRKGEAADIEIKGLSNYELATWISENLDYDQLILEFADDLENDINDGWVHVSYKSPSENRKQDLTINNDGTQLGLII